MSPEINFQPKEYHTVTPYLVVENAAGLLEFMKAVFGAEPAVLMNKMDGSVMHAEVPVGDSVIMLSDSNEQNPPIPAMLYVYVEDCDATYQKALAAGAASVRTPRNEFFGDRTANVRDPFGNRWEFATHVEDVSAEQMQSRMESGVV